MSQENIEIVRQAWEAYVRRDNEDALAFYDPEVEIDMTGLGGQRLGSRLYRGIDGVREWFADWHGAFGDATMDVDEWIDAGENVIAVTHLHGRGKASGAPVEMAQAHVWTLRDQKLLKLRIYASRAEALEAAGLRE